MLHRTRALALATTAMALGAAGTAQAAETLYGITPGDELVTLGTDAPGAASPARPITGLAPGDTVAGVDVRPATGQLYALASSGALYVVDPVTAAARRINDVPLEGTRFGVDFNPAADALRIVSDTGRNLRVTQGGVGPTVVDGALGGAGTSAVAAAYTQNFHGTGATRLYDVDAAGDRLLEQTNPNGGVLAEVGPLGVDVGPDASLDVAASGDLAYLTSGNLLYTVDLASGRAISRAELGTPLKAITAARQAPVLHVLDEDGTTLSTVRSARSLGSTALTELGARPVRGLPGGVTLVGLDTRPADGTLVGLGSDGRTYTLDPESGRATTPAGGATLDGTVFGVDFNPAANALRVVSDAAQNLRYPAGGAGVAVVDGALSGGSTVVEVAYTNNVAGAATTQLLDIDAAGDRLLRQDPPNAGTLTEIGPLGTDVEDAGFDITGQDGSALLAAAAPLSATSELRRVNLATGRASSVASLPAGLRAIGLTAAGPGTVAFTALSSTVREGDTARIGIRRDGGDGVVTVVVTAGSTARAVTFQPGETLKAVDVATSTDGDVALTLLRAAGGPVIGTPSATLRVVDGDVSGSSVDRGRPVALVVARDLRLRTLRARGVSALLSVNEAARVELTLRLGSRTVGRAVTRTSGASVKRVRATLTSNGKRVVGRSKTRRLQLRAVITDPAGNRSTVISAFAAKR